MEDQLREFIRSRLRILRREKGMTSAQVAAEARISRSNYSSIETGASWPSLVTLHRILMALKADISSVWPVYFDASGDATGALSCESLFRFREVVLLSEAEAGALFLLHADEVTSLAQLRVPESDWPLLLGLVRGEREGKAPWKSYSASSGSYSLFLCLRNLRRFTLAQMLTGVYLPFWLVSIRFGVHDADGGPLALRVPEPTAC